MFSRFLKSKLFQLILLAVGLMVVYSLSLSVIDLWKHRDLVTERQAALKSVKAENERLKRALEESQSEEFIEREAREKLGLSKPGEVIVFMEKPIEATNPGQVQEASGPNWKKWWKLFF